MQHAQVLERPPGPGARLQGQLEEELLDVAGDGRRGCLETGGDRFHGAPLGHHLEQRMLRAGKPTGRGDGAGHGLDDAGIEH